MFEDTGTLLVRLLLPVSFILTGVALFLSLEGCYPRTTSAADSPKEIPGEISRRIALDVGIVVSDMDTSLQFYHGVLGLPIVAEVRTSLIGAGTMVQLQHGASLIKLLHMDTPPEAHHVKGITTVYGHRYVTLMVEDIDPLATKIDETEISVVMPLTKLGNGAYIMMVERS